MLILLAIRQIIIMENCFKSFMTVFGTVIVFFHTAFGQLVNDGSTLYIGANAILTIESSLNNSGSIIVESTSGTGKIIVTEDFTNNASFDAGQGYVLLNGGLQSIKSNDDAFYNLIIDGSDNKTLVQNNIVVNNALELKSSANVITDSLFVEISLNGDVNRTYTPLLGGAIIGTLKRNFNASNNSLTYHLGSLEDYYTPVEVNLGNPTGALTITSKSAIHPQMQGSGISSFKTCRTYWTFEENALNYSTASVTFTHNQHVLGGNNFDDYLVASYDEDWMMETVTSTDANSVTANVSTLNADFVIGEEGKASLNYAILKKKLDAGYYRGFAGRIYFNFEGEYNYTGPLNYTIYRSDRTPITTDVLIQQLGYNEYALNLSGQSSFFSEGDYYILEVKNAKKETFKLRFKYNSSL